MCRDPARTTKCATSDISATGHQQNFARRTDSGKPYANPDLLGHTEEKHDRHWKTKNRPRKPPKSERRAGADCLFFELSKRGKFRLTDFSIFVSPFAL